MDNIDWNNIDRELTRCHPALMKVWNRYREQMHRRGFETGDFLNELALTVLENRDQFRGTTRPDFCKWSQKILDRKIHTVLRRFHPDTIDSAHNLVDRRQGRPSVVFQEECRRKAIILAFDSLPEPERTLFELKHMSRPKLSIKEVGERLRIEHIDLWEIHQRSWIPEEPKLRRSCEQSREAFEEAAMVCYRVLEGIWTSDDPIE
jgi:RNA polymerase sigma factor (sigma-70 family)